MRCWMFILEDWFNAGGRWALAKVITILHDLRSRVWSCWSCSNCAATFLQLSPWPATGMVAGSWWRCDAPAVHPCVWCTWNHSILAPRRLALGCGVVDAAAACPQPFHAHLHHCRLVPYPCEISELDSPFSLSEYQSYLLEVSPKLMIW